jgi:RNA polymerase sigma-70 factor (ECF subfamily)
LKLASVPVAYFENDVPNLVERLRRQERAALGEAYDAHQAAARGLARRLVGEDAAAEDLVQEAFVLLPRAVHRFDGTAALRTFILAIVVNCARHHVRSAARRRRLAESYGREPRTTSLDGDAAAARQDLAQLLTRALDELPLEQRTAFVLMELEERTSVDAGAIAGAPEATMRTRLFHAKRKLRERLEAWGAR